ncbi:hypothetical protein HPP92_020038 [Vanilla planifolia]|uniref:Uncharacterized protein n=1 Tax=Vanilla planifolia TaxID=51239 RepID=A0A835Q569_VANPL|nr:hypothetical protein HPP92_020038 [Vanilla planifolia]
MVDGRVTECGDGCSVHQTMVESIESFFYKLPKDEIANSLQKISCNAKEPIRLSQKILDEYNILKKDHVKKAE